MISTHPEFPTEIFGRDYDARNNPAYDAGLTQEQRPHVFVTKHRRRVGGSPRLATRSRPSRHISVSEFASIYAAAEFAAHHGFLLDFHITIDFERLAILEPKEVQAELSRFLRCYDAWCRERLIPPLSIYSVEMSRALTYHAHVALYVPEDFLPGDPNSLRAEFRRWAKDYTRRNFDQAVPRAIRVRGDRRHSVVSHWRTVSYLVKGYDRNAMICSARNSPDGRPIMLGDIIPWAYCDPGPVALNKRIGVSQSLGPQRRAFGAPSGCDYLLPHQPNLNALFLNDRPVNSSVPGNAYLPPRIPIPTPFRSTFEDGIYDVRRLYPPEFYAFITKLGRAAETPKITRDKHILQMKDRRDDEGWDIVAVDPLRCSRPVPHRSWS